MGECLIRIHEHILSTVIRQSDHSLPGQCPKADHTGFTSDLQACIHPIYKTATVAHSLGKLQSLNQSFRHKTVYYLCLKLVQDLCYPFQSSKACILFVVLLTCRQHNKQSSAASAVHVHSGIIEGGVGMDKLIYDRLLEAVLGLCL